MKRDLEGKHGTHGWSQLTIKGVCLWCIKFISEITLSERPLWCFFPLLISKRPNRWGSPASELPPTLNRKWNLWLGPSFPGGNLCPGAVRHYKRRDNGKKNTQHLSEMASFFFTSWNVKVNMSISPFRLGAGARSVLVGLVLCAALPSVPVKQCAQ